MQLTSEQRVFVVEQFYLTASPTKIKRAYFNKYRQEVSLNTINKLIIKWKDRGTILNQNKDHSGRKRTARSEENIAMIEERITESSQSLRKLAAETGLKRESVRRILKHDLKLKSYKLHMSQQLSINDQTRRLEFCLEIKNMVQRNELDIKSIIFSDESHIHLNKFMNKQNFRMWSSNKPMVVFEKPLHSPKVTVWCGMSGNRLYGPFFFDDAQTGNACTITTETYIEMLETVMNVDITPDMWFQQDGATAHTSVIARDWLKSRFGNKVISHRTDFPWPARSPDLSPLDFFLWSYVKEKVFSTRPVSINDLKIAVREALALIDQDTLAAVTANFEKRVELCIQQRGGHFEHLL